MLVETQIEILQVQSSFLFSNQPFEKRPVMIIEDFGLHSDDHFESHLLGNGLSQDDPNCETNHPNKILLSLIFLTCACCNSIRMKKTNHYEQIHVIWRRNQ